MSVESVPVNVWSNRGLILQLFVEFWENKDSHHERDVERKGDKNHHAFLFAGRLAYDELIVGCMLQVVSIVVATSLLRHL